MPQFKYTARTPDGKTLSGLIAGTNQADATAKLKKQNLNIVAIREDTKKKKGFNVDLFQPKAGDRVKGEDLTVFTRQLATMIAAGVPLLESLEVLQEQTDNKGFKLTLEGIVEKIRGGSDFSAALETYPKIFTRIYVSMVKAGEAGGQIDSILVRLAEYMESAEQLKREIKSAMTYPVISLGLIFSIVIGLMVFIIPNFEKIFMQMGIPLPLPTKIILMVSKFMTGYWYTWIGGIVALVVGFGTFKRSKVGQYSLDWFALNAPVFGDLFTKVAISRFCRTFSTLIKSGVPILGALEIVAATSGNTIIENTVNNAKESVRKGETLSEPLSHSKVFPPMVTRMIGIGEKSGALEALLEKISEFYDQQVKATVEGLTSMIEPIMIGIMGIVVGGIVLAIFMPIFDIQKSLSKKG